MREGKGEGWIAGEEGMKGVGGGRKGGREIKMVGVNWG
jgi:hypothetical protein